MIHEPEKIKSIYNNIILKKNSLKNINKIETSVSQEKREKETDRNSTYIKSANTYNNKKNKIKVCLFKIDKKGNKFIYLKKYKHRRF